ncbi:histidinol-phosphatase (PHP family) [Bacillus oleivorans]|uniref:Histidinol-phosphatase n=1 Tax=Bacillus oleivorans TaxID=1448271 RepID=A0A285CUZ8_9BACI|nr:histidinol-phosphatase HisJ [Bacillus oleivorans]SNX71401.1 histidinol-phosphatase (PHP family) [Bacillus oleivorans]
MEKRDAHIHTPYCPHGAKDKFEEYIEQALIKGFSSITFTEHAPLPHSFADPTPLKDSAMKEEDVEPYIIEINRLKEQYKNEITIKTGFEVDYIAGFEEETQDFLNRYGPQLDDSILSVHFIKCHDQWLCIDYSPDTFSEAIRLTGGADHVYQLYFNQVLKSIRADLGPFKPRRIGHITLAAKFQKKYPPSHSFSSSITEILKEIKEKRYELDMNTAGLRKPLCREIYPRPDILTAAKQMGIPLVFGSDAHHAKELGADYSLIQEYL